MPLFAEVPSSRQRPDETHPLALPQHMLTGAVVLQGTSVLASPFGM
jgi:hypothetical protein